MENLKEKIALLNTDELLEATQILANEIIDGADTTAEENVIQPLLTNPAAHLKDIETVCRLLLNEAAESEEYKALVLDAVSNTGRKNFIMGGWEIVALAAVVVAGIRVVRNPVQSIEESEENGKKYRKVIYNADSSFMDKLMELIKAK